MVANSKSWVLQKVSTNKCGAIFIINVLIVLNRKHWWWGGAAGWVRTLDKGCPWPLCSTCPWPVECWAGDITTQTAAAEPQAEQTHLYPSKLYLWRTVRKERYRQRLGRVWLLSMVWVSETWHAWWQSSWWWVVDPARGWLLPQWMLGLCSVFISLRLVFPDSHLEIQPELVTSFFCSEAHWVGVGAGESREGREGQVHFNMCRAQRRERSAACAAGISGTPEELGGSCHSAPPSGRVSGVRTELPLPACGNKAKAAPQIVPTMEYGNELLCFRV